MKLNGSRRLLCNLLDFDPLSIGRFCPGRVQLLVWGGRSHGYQGEEECKHDGASSMGNDGARDARNLKYPKFDPELRIVVVVRGVGKVTVTPTWAT